MSKPTNLPDFFQSLGGGVTGDVLAKMLTDAGIAVLVNNGKKSAKVTLELTISKMSEDSDTGLKIDAKLSHKVPTQRGDKSENESRESIHYMNPQAGLVDTPPKRKEEDQHASMAHAMPATTGFRGS